MTPGLLGRALNLLGVVIVGGWVLSVEHQRLTPDVLLLSALALLGWAAWSLLPLGRIRDVTIVVAALAAALGIGATHAVLVAAAIAGLLGYASLPAHRPGTSVALAVACILLLVVSTVLYRQPSSFLLSAGSGLAVAALAGMARRQSRVGEARERELLTRSLEIERQTVRSQLLAERAAAARDIHDVLAHSLGGLVLQLDAVGALLERGREEEAAARVEQARRLAADGLAEARRAVTALRDPGAPAEVRPSPSALEDLLATHRALGGEVVVEGDLSLAGLDDPHRDAVVRLVQESLSNARRHSPGLATRVTVARDDGALRITVTTPVPRAAGPKPGGGHGITGMRERFAALDDGSTVTAGANGDRFVVDARVVLP